MFLQSSLCLCIFILALLGQSTAQNGNSFDIFVSGEREKAKR